ncbi:MAG: TonB-dependent receptor [Bacteroidota bacterium]
MDRGKIANRIILLTVVLMAVIPVLHAQKTEKKITVNFQNATLKGALDEIALKGDILFSYNPRKLPLHEKVNLVANNKSVRIVLDELLLPIGIIWIVTEHQVVLKMKKHRESVNPMPAETRKFTISGYVRDKNTGEVLIGANVYDKQTYKGTTTNGYGFFSLTLPEKDCSIFFSLIGYTTYNQHLILNKDETFNISLEEARIEMKTVEILADKDIQIIDPVASGEVRLSSAALKRMAGFAGNIDVLKSLQSVPGINAFGDGSSFFYVRGGNNDQNLMLIDEAPIFNPAHLFGFFSALAPDAIKDVKAYKGDFPASYGGRLSSVIDIRARDGNLNRFGFSGNLGIFTSDLTVEGPLVREKSSFILSARKSNLNWLSNEGITGKSFTINFYDLNAKLNLKLNDKNRLFLTGFTGKDDFSRLTNASVHTFGISWDNSTATIRWNHLFNKKLFSNTTAVFSEYNYYLYISREQDDYWQSSIRNKTLKTDFTWYPDPANTLKGGAELSNYHSNPGNVHFSDDETQKNAPFVPEYNSVGLSIYLSNDQLIREKLLIKYGLRLSTWRNLGPATVYFYDAGYQVADTVQVERGNYFSPYTNFEPRISIAYAIGPNASFTGGYSRTAQYLQMLSNSTSPFTSLEVWAPSGPNIKPQTADQFTLGFITKPGKTEINYSIEAFYKLFHNQVEYMDHANMLFNPLIEGELRFGDAKSYGAEFLARKNKGKITGWIGYSYARILKTIEDINQDKEFPATYDHPHSLFANIIFSAGKRWDMAAGWFYMTGSAFTAPTGFIQYNGYNIPVYSSKNNDRLPDYHRLDLSVSFRLNNPSKRFRHNLILSVYNIYGRKNPFAVSFNKVMNDNGEFVVPSDLNGSYEVIPTSISVAGMIPSINYTFKF